MICVGKKVEPAAAQDAYTGRMPWIDPAGVCVIAVAWGFSYLPSFSFFDVRNVLKH